MTENDRISLDYESGKRPRGVSPIWELVCAAVTICTSYVVIMGYADVLLIPAYVGWLMAVIGFVPLWKLRRWGTLCMLAGLILLLTGIALYVALLVSAIWRLPDIIDHLDLRDLCALAAFVLDITAIGLLARRLRRPSGGITRIRQTGDGAVQQTEGNISPANNAMTANATPRLHEEKQTG